MSTLVVDLLDVIVLGFPSSLACCHDVLSLRILRSYPVTSTNFCESVLVVDVVASSLSTSYRKMYDLP